MATEVACLIIEEKAIKSLINHFKLEPDFLFVHSDKRLTRAKQLEQLCNLAIDNDIELRKEITTLKRKLTIAENKLAKEVEPKGG